MPTKTSSNLCASNIVVKFLVFTLLIAAIVPSLNIPSIFLTFLPEICEQQDPTTATPTYWIPDDGYHMQVVHKIFHSFGFKKFLGKNSWDVFWSSQYPFDDCRNWFQSLKPHQKVNHVPGIYFLTSKVELSMTDVDFIPKSFRIPEDMEELKNYSSKNPGYKFLIKGNTHRNIEMVNVDDIDVTRSESFIQKFVDNPYLVDGHKFDFGKKHKIGSQSTWLNFSLF